ncbi:hypothetical protein FLW16_10460 [Microbispora sp. KK1-11]|nr:hypothetical protein FLW16_10460 [Microbispora sp. KK1-11]
MSVVAFPAHPTPPADPATGPATGSPIAAAVERFLESMQAATTRTSYTETLARLTAVAGLDYPVAALTPEQYAAVMERWTTAAAATWNRHLSALVSFTTWAQRQDLLATNPARRLERRKPARRGDRAIPAARLDKLFTNPAHALRERVLWSSCMTRRPAPRRSSASTSRTSTWSSAAPGSSPRAAPSSTCTGPPPPPGCCPAC